MNKLLLATLFIGVSVMAMSSRTHQPIDVISGDSFGKYSKPGAPVEIVYTTEHVNSGDICEVKVTLSTTQKSGMMSISTKVDERLNQITVTPQEVRVDLETIQGEYPLEFSLSADSDGLYYIKLHITIEGKGMRAFAIPIYVGDEKTKKKISKVVQHSATGENISVSPAVETIK